MTRPDLPIVGSVRDGLVAEAELLGAGVLLLALLGGIVVAVVRDLRTESADRAEAAANGAWFWTLAELADAPVAELAAGPVAGQGRSAQETQAPTRPPVPAGHGRATTAA